MKTSELIGPALDWAVAEAEGVEYRYMKSTGGDYNSSWWWETRRYSTDWAIAGPIIERERINTIVTFTGETWIGHIGHDGNYAFHQTGPTPLIAAMRCRVAARFGNEIDIPEELLP